ncbi:MAG: terminase gpA endonuclease subunit, partial [Bauldia sp.]
GSPLEVDAQHKAAKYGTRPYMAGVSRAKDLILGADEMAGRVNLRDSDTATGRGPGRLHWYRGVRADYFEQLTAEVKAPARVGKGPGALKKVWQRKAGKHNEFLDCEVYALHAARALRLDTYTAAAWKSLATRILQGHLFAPGNAEGATAAAAQAPETTDAAPAQDAVQTSGPAPDPVPVQPAAIAGRPSARRRGEGARRMRSGGVRL